MSQEIKLMVRPGIGRQESSVRVEQELNSLMSDVGGWKLRDVFHIGQEKDGGHNMLFVFIREVGEPVAQVTKSFDVVSENTLAKRGRPPKVV
jgi:hypothetical protein